MDRVDLHSELEPFDRRPVCQEGRKPAARRSSRVALETLYHRRPHQEHQVQKEVKHAIG